MKKIFVNSYTKRDGTQVKEHYRTIEGESFAPQTPPVIIEENPQQTLPLPLPQYMEDPLFKTSASYDYFLASIENESLPNKDSNNGSNENSNEGSSISNILSTIAKVGTQALSIASELLTAYNNANTSAVAILKPQLNTTINNMKTLQQKNESISKKYLDRLTTTKDKQEYKNLFENYVKQRETNIKMNEKIAKIEFAAENNNYETVYKELQNYQSDFDEVKAKNQEQRPLNKIKKTPIKLYNSTPVPTPYMNNYIPNNNISPLNTKKILDLGTYGYNIIHHTPNTQELWKAFSHDFNQSKEYIEQNGNLIYSVTELPSRELQNIVSRKLQEQLGVSDSLGVIFKSYSSLSKAISQSNEFKDFFLKNKNDLLKGKIVNKSSTYFTKNNDLKNSLGHADILYSYIDQYGNLRTLVMDTYDFNKNENILIEMARTVQDAGIARNYYTLTIVIIPIFEWIKWLK